MPGIVSRPTWLMDGQYLPLTVENAAITLGEVVALGNAAGTARTGTAATSAKAIGVAVSARRFSRTQTDSSVAVGEVVTVATRGVVHVVTNNSNIAVGSYVEAANDGKVALHTAGSGDYVDVLGIALDANGSTDGTVIRVKLMRG